MTLKFSNIHCHTNLSIYDSIKQAPEYIDYILSTGGDSIAFTEHGNMSSYPYYYLYTEKLKKQGVKIKSIPGIEAYFIPSLKEWQEVYNQTREEKEEGKKLRQKSEETETLVYEVEEDTKKLHFDKIKHRNHLILLAKNEQGLTSLFTLVSQSFKHGFYKYPRLDFDALTTHNKDKNLVCLSGCVAGPFSSLVSRLSHENKTYDEIQAELLNLTDRFVSLFGHENFFYEIQFNKLSQQHTINQHLLDLSKRTGIKLVVTNDCHYPRPELWKDRELYKKLGRLNFKDENLKLPETVDELDYELYPKNAEDTYTAYKKYCSTYSFYNDEVIKEAINNSWHITNDLVQDIKADTSIKLPEFKSPTKQLTELCLKAMKDKELDKKQEYVDRLKEELELIKEKKFENYFLTLHKGVNAIKKHLLLGTSRGSGGGSLVLYLLDINQVDSVRFDLLFSRFLSKARVQYPDVDLDFENKDKVTKILKKTFGDDNVVPISNYNTMQLKSLIKDISKFYDVPFQEVNTMTRVIEQEVRKKVLKKGDDKNLFQLTWENTTEHSPTFNNFIEKYPHVATHIKVLFQQNRSIGRHAGGILICPNLENRMPLIKSGGVIQSPLVEGVTAKHLEEFGFLKFDCLALLTLRIIRNCIEKILINKGKKPTFDNVKLFYNKHLHPDNANLDDEKVFKNVWWKGRYPAIFQFSEKNVQRFGKQFKPSSIDDISSITSIWRPGPLAADVHTKVLNVRAGKTQVIYEHPAIEECLKKTNGELIYQEEMLLIANKLAGMNMEDCDALRKAVLKRIFSTKDEALVKRNKLKVKFIDGCVANNFPKHKAEELFKKIEFCAGYLFNKSHSLGYSLISYQCAWLFTYHEKEWLQAYLENKEDTGAKENVLDEIKKLRYEFIKPDINLSTDTWEIEDKKIYFSLNALKGLGKKAVFEIITKKPYNTIDDLLFDENKALNKKPLEVLIKIGALDSTQLVGKDKLFNSYKHMHNVVIENFAKLKSKKCGKENLEKLLLELPRDEEWNAAEKLENINKIMGLVDSSVLLSDSIKQKLEKHNIKSIDEFDKETMKKDLVWFVIKDVSTKLTKNNKPYAIISSMGTRGIDTRIRQWNTNGNGYKKYGLYVAEIEFDEEWGFSIRNNTSRVMQLG